MRLYGSGVWVQDLGFNPLTTAWAASASVLRSSTQAFVGIQERIHLGATKKWAMSRFRQQGLRHIVFAV